MRFPIFSVLWRFSPSSWIAMNMFLNSFSRSNFRSFSWGSWVGDGSIQRINARYFLSGFVSPESQKPLSGLVELKEFLWKVGINGTHQKTHIWILVILKIFGCKLNILCKIQKKVLSIFGSWIGNQLRPEVAEIKGGLKGVKLQLVATELPAGGWNRGGATWVERWKTYVCVKKNL